jgi:hypothetical protein
LHVVTGGKNCGGGCGFLSSGGRLVADVIVGFYGSLVAVEDVFMRKVAAERG